MNAKITLVQRFYAALYIMRPTLALQMKIVPFTLTKMAGCLFMLTVAFSTHSTNYFFTSQPLRPSHIFRRTIRPVRSKTEMRIINSTLPPHVKIIGFSILQSGYAQIGSISPRRRSIANDSFHRIQPIQRIGRRFSSQLRSFYLRSEFHRKFFHRVSSFRRTGLSQKISKRVTSLCSLTRFHQDGDRSQTIRFKNTAKGMASFQEGRRCIIFCLQWFMFTEFSALGLWAMDYSNRFYQQED